MSGSPPRPPSSIADKGESINAQNQPRRTSLLISELSQQNFDYQEPSEEIDFNMDAGSVGGDSAAQNTQMVIAEDPEPATPIVDLLDDQTPHNEDAPGPGAMVVADDPEEDPVDAAPREPPAERGVASSASIDMTENPFLAMQQQAQEPVSAEPDGTRLATSGPPSRGLPRGQSIDMTDGQWDTEPAGEYTDPQATKDKKKKRSKRKSKKGHHDDVGYEPKPGEPTFYDQQALKKPASGDDASKLSHDYIQPFYREGEDEESEPDDEFMDEDGYYDDYHDDYYSDDDYEYGDEDANQYGGYRDEPRRGKRPGVDRQESERSSRPGMFSRPGLERSHSQRSTMSERSGYSERSGRSRRSMGSFSGRWSSRSEEEPMDYEENEEWFEDEMRSLASDDQLTEEARSYKERRLHFLRIKRREKLRRREREEKERLERRRQRRKFMSWCCCCLCCCIVLFFIFLLIMWLLPKDDSLEKNIVDDDDAYEDDWVPFQPYKGILTTPMDPYEEEDCYFGDNVFPHMIQQCECFGNITIIPEDVLMLWYELREDVKEEIYNGDYDEPPWSCEPSNQALIWLASGDNRDNGDLWTRYIIGVSFVQLNGTQWDLNNGWLTPENECAWIGIQCNGRFQTNSFALDTNNVHGSLPTELYKMRGMRTLSITRNHLSGTIPIEILLMPKLEHLSLYANQMRGSIPSEIAKATRLKSFLVSNNLFFGRLTSYIGEVTTLEKFSIGFNEFWRKIPTEIGLMTNLRLLVLEDNRFSGTVPTEVARLTNLEYFYMSRNLMVGTMPTIFASLTNLLDFRLAFSGLGGTIPTEFQVMTSMYRFDAGGNNFGGTVMTEFGFMTGLSWLALNDNEFSGTIPTEIGYLANMTRLSFKDTNVRGNIPTELGYLTKLQDLALSQTNLNGESPDEVCALRLLDLNLYVTDCPGRGDSGVICSVPDCCTFCRRGEQNAVGGGGDTGADAGGSP